MPCYLYLSLTDKDCLKSKISILLFTKFFKASKIVHNQFSQSSLKCPYRPIRIGIQMKSIHHIYYSLKASLILAYSPTWSNKIHRITRLAVINLSFILKGWQAALVCSYVIISWWGQNGGIASNSFICSAGILCWLWTKP